MADEDRDTGTLVGRVCCASQGKTPTHLLQPGNAAQHIVASSERIRADLRYTELVDIDEAIRRTIAWEQSNPPTTIDPQQFNYDAEDAALASRA